MHLYRAEAQGSFCAGLAPTAEAQGDVRAEVAPVTISNKHFSNIGLFEACAT